LGIVGVMVKVRGPKAEETQRERESHAEALLKGEQRSENENKHEKEAK